MSEQDLLAVIGGSGLYDLPDLENVEERKLSTPFGDPSSPIILGTLAGRPMAFVARHGRQHSINPSEINYRANIYALKSLGARFILSVSACGSLREDFEPGHFVIPDQLFDFTHKRERSFFGDGLVVHVGVADPFCAHFGNQVLEASQAAGAEAHKGGSFITIEGPRFSTRSESNTYQSWGHSIIGMTTSPEAFLAREAELHYAVLAHVTDYDVWHDEPVSVEMVMRTVTANTEKAKDTIRHLAANLKAHTPCDCEDALANAIVTRMQDAPEDTRQKLALLIEKYN